MAIWSVSLGLPVLAFGGVALFFPSVARKAASWFFVSRPVACVLVALGWIWTAYECDIIGIDAFDAVTKIFPGELWILAVVLTFLTVAWMPKNLSVRALCGILMLIPAEFFKTAHAYRPAQGVAFAPVDVMVALVYLALVAGMYGMFYPWRIEKALDAVLSRNPAARIMGALMLAAGGAFMAIGIATA